MNNCFVIFISLPYESVFWGSLIVFFRFVLFFFFEVDYKSLYCLILSLPICIPEGPLKLQLLWHTFHHLTFPLGNTFLTSLGLLHGCRHWLERAALPTEGCAHPPAHPASTLCQTELHQLLQLCSFRQGMNWLCCFPFILISSSILHYLNLHL